MNAKRAIRIAGAAVTIYVAAAIGIQAGLRALAIATVVFLGIAVSAGLVFGFVRLRISAVLFAAVLPLALWIWVFGSYSFTRDVLGGALGLVLAWPLARWLTGWRRVLLGGEEEPPERPRRRFVRRFLLATFVLIWAINSSLNVVFESDTLPRNATPLAVARGNDAPWPDLDVGVALSGGGYRATLMHAGVLAELDAMRVPVSAVSSVSGGSIVGSFYAAGGAPADLRDAIAAGRFNLKRDLADMHNTLRLPFPFELPYVEARLFPWMAFGRVDVQAGLVDRVLLGGVTLGEIEDPGRPRLQICTSDLRTGSAVGLSSDGALVQSPARPARDRRGGAIPYEVRREFHAAIDPATPVADLVAASGAFPGAFAALELTLPEGNGSEPRRLLLADGGIVDNWGVGLLLGRAREPGDDPWRLDALLVSAGGRVFAQEEEVPAPEEVRRAIDIIYETAGWRPVDLVGEPKRPPIVLLRPDDVAHDTPEYRTFAATTTLTDRFSDEDARRLFDLGRALVRNAAGEIEALLDAAARERLAADPADPTGAEPPL